MASRNDLERDLKKARAKVDRCDEATKAAMRNRDRLVRELRQCDPAPSLRLVAEMAGVSHVQVSNIEAAGQ